MLNQIQIGNRTFEWGSRTFIMGILNITPDSFSGDGLMAHEKVSVEAALKLANDFVAAGADILDIGGESTRPGANTIMTQEEIDRVLPVIESIREEFDIILSIDTYKAGVAQEAIQAGASIVNDVWGLKADPKMARVVAQNQVPVILMHNRSNPASADIRERLGGRYVGMEYENLIEDVKQELMENVHFARENGISDHMIILDPGIGFGKTVTQNLQLINHLDEIRSLGFPILLGPSRKSFIGYTLDLPPDDRVEGTAAAVAIGIARGADIIRVHDVAVMSRVATMTDAIIRSSRS